MRWWRRYLAWRLRHVVRLEALPDGFACRAYRGDTVIRWAAITRVAAYKRDLLTTDLLCLLVEAGASLVELHEDMPGFAPVIAAMEDALTIDPAWRLAVLFPAFETNATVLFGPPLDPARPA